MQIVKMGALVSLLLLVSFGLALAHWSGNDANNLISHYPGDNYGTYKARIATDNSPSSPYYGNIYAVWVGWGSSPREIYFSRSTDHGATWSGTASDQMISANDGQNAYITYGDKSLDIAVNDSGEIFVVWSEDLVDDREIMMVKSSDGGNTWLHSDTDFPISYNGVPAVDAGVPKMAIDDNDNIYVVWHQDTAIDTAEIHISISTDDGSTWSGTVEDRAISYRDASDAVLPDVAVASNGDVYVVWAEKSDPSDITSYQILYGKSNDGGATFNSTTADFPISAPIRSSGDPLIGIDNSDNIHVIWGATQASVSPFYYEIFYSRSTDGGANWSASADTIAIDDGVADGQSANNHGFTVTSAGKLAAVWNENREGSPKSEIWASYSTDGGDNWTGPFSPDLVSYIGANDGHSYNPDIVVDAGDTLHLVFYGFPDTLASYYEALYSRSDTLAGEVGPTPGRLEGVVTDYDTSNPLNEVTVTVDTNGVVIDSDITDINGEYSITLDPLAYYSATYNIYTHLDSTISPITILEGQVTTLDVALHRETPGTISGHIHEETGTNPLTNAAILAYDGPSMGDDSTDGSGYYEIELYPGTYTMEITADLFEDTTITNVVLESGGSVVVDVNMRWAIPADDIGPVAIIEPPDVMLTGTAYTPKIEVENYGYQDQTFDLNLVITDESFIEVYNETYYGATVDSLSTVLVTMGADFTPVTQEIYTFTVTVTNVGDEEPANDVYTADIDAYTHQGYGGPDGYGYSFKDNTAPCGPTFSWIDISATGTQIEPTLHYFMSDPLPVGFNMEFYGNSYNTMYVNSHGAVHLGIRSAWWSTNDCPVPDSTTPNAPMLMAFWDLLEITHELGHGVYYQYFDEPDVDYTVVQWNIGNGNVDDTLEFEIILYENGRILYQYNQVAEQIPAGQGQGATVGLEFDVLPDFYGLSYLCNDDNPANRLTDGLAIEWLVDADLPGSVTGTVTDASTLDPIEGVFVEAVNLGIGDVTDINGEYTLPGLYACDYSISFSHNDYVDTVVTGVTVLPDTTVTLDVAMQVQVFGYEYLPGDANMWVGAWPPSVIGGDVTYLVGYFRGINGPCLLGDETTNFYCSGDANGDCLVIGSDVTRLVSYFRGLAIITPCPDYEPAWPTPGDLPGEAPSGWPNCLTPIVSGNLIKGGLNNR